MDAFLEVVLDDGEKDPRVIFEKATKKIGNKKEVIKWN